MKRTLVTICFVLALIQASSAQVITALPCDQLGMSINVGSDSTSISIYHSGQYLTHPQAQNNFDWEFTDQQGNVLNQFNIVNNAFANFSMNWSTNDTIDVKVHFVNDSAFLANGNSINCLFEDQIHWKLNYYPNGNPYWRWEFIHNNTGIDLNNSNGIADQNAFFGPQLFPNPVSDVLHIAFVKNQEARVQILTLSGQKVEEIELNGAALELDLSALKTGFYLVKIQTASALYQEKVYKM